MRSAVDDQKHVNTECRGQRSSTYTDGIDHPDHVSQALSAFRVGPRAGHGSAGAQETVRVRPYVTSKASTVLSRTQGMHELWQANRLPVDGFSVDGAAIMLEEEAVATRDGATSLLNIYKCCLSLSDVLPIKDGHLLR